MIPTDPHEARALADQERQAVATAAWEADYADDLADALELDRLALVLRVESPPVWTITYRGAVLGEVTNDRPGAVIGGWTARPTSGEPTGPHRTARAAAASMIPAEERRPGHAC